MGSPGARYVRRARHSPILLPPPLAERDGQDRGSRLVFMARCSGEGLQKQRQKKAPLRVLVVFFEAGASLRERHSARHGTRAPATRPWGDRCDEHQIMLAAEHGWALLVRGRCYAPPVRAGKGVASSLDAKLGRVRRVSRGRFAGIADKSAPTERDAAAERARCCDRTSAMLRQNERDAATEKGASTRSVGADSSAKGAGIGR
jgi:hypothetical protein